MEQYNTATSSPWDRVWDTSHDTLEAARDAGQQSQAALSRHGANLVHSILTHARHRLRGERVPPTVHNARKEAMSGIRDHLPQFAAALALAGTIAGAHKLRQIWQDHQNNQTGEQDPSRPPTFDDHPADTPVLAPTLALSEPIPDDDEAFVPKRGEKVVWL